MKKQPYPQELGFLVTLQMTVPRQLLALYVPKQLKGCPRTVSTRQRLSDPSSVLLFWIDHFPVFPSPNKVQSSSITKTYHRFLHVISKHPRQHIQFDSLYLSLTLLSQEAKKRIDTHVSLNAHKGFYQKSYENSYYHY